MKIALGTPYPFNENVIQGGVEAVALYLAQALGKREDIELHIVSCSRLISRSRTQRRGSVTFHWLAAGEHLLGLRASTVNAWRIREVYRKVRPDVIHAQDFTEYAMAASPGDCLLLTTHGVEPLVPRMHETAHFRGGAGIYRKWIAYWLVRQCLRKAKGIVSNAGDYIPMLLAKWLNGKAIFPIFNPIADDFFRIESTEVAGRPVMLWVGEISERKNLLELIEVFAGVSQQVPEARMRVIGRVAEPAYFDRVKDAIAARRLGDRIDILGQVEQTTLLKVYAAASILTMVSIEETAPMAIAQAMAAGKPTVATRVGGIPWMIEDGVTGFLVEVGDIQSMVDHIVKLLRDKTSRERLGLASRKIARQRFAADMVAEQTVQAYRYLLGKKEM